MARGVVAFRGLALTWAWVGFALERDHLNRPWLAVAVLLTISLFTLWITVVALSGESVFRTDFIAAELALGVGVLVVDGLVYDALRQQSLPWSWPAAGIITAAIVGGVRWGLLTSLLIGGASFIGESILRDTLQWKISTASKSALWVLAALAAGSVARRLRESEEKISAARAREEMARVLHDGVMQTLAVIGRRSTDTDLRALAARQEEELRVYVSAQHEPASLPAVLGHTVETIRQRHHLAIELVIAEDIPDIGDEAIRALAGAVGEALTNAAKHSQGDRVVVFVEPGVADRELACSVRDNGSGFDVGVTQTGLGVRHSIRGRIEEIGGRVEIDSTIGRGTEVRLWVT